MIEISRRLQAIANEVPAGSRLADIGSDHALLPAFLAKRGIIESAIAGELNPGPFAAAEKQVRESSLGGKIRVRQGDGLSVLEPGEADVVTIAGMGGSLIARILEDGLPKLGQVNRLVLQPNVGEDAVRKWLVEHHWWLSMETILEEDGKIYEILTALRISDADEKNDSLYSERERNGIKWTRSWLLRMGPYLSEEACAVFRLKWAEECRKREMIGRQLMQSDLESAAVKRRILEEEIQFIREVLECTQTGKPLSR